MKKKPEKKCPECADMCHARKSVCSCGYQFYEKASDKQKRLSKDWRGLNRGDVINKGRVKGAEREFIYMGKPELCPTTGVIHKESHKILVLKKNES